MMSARLANSFLLVRLLSLLTICLAQPARATRGKDEVPLQSRAIIEISLADDEGTESEAESKEIPSKPPESLSQKIIGLLHGIYVNFKPSENVTGFLRLIPEQQKSIDYKANAPDNGNWVGVIICSDTVSEEDLTGTTTTSRDVLIERMKNAVLLGASAFIILAMNRNVLKEVQMDISNAVTKVPVVLIDNLHNITNLLSILASKLKFRVSMSSYTTKEDVQTYTIWSTCWRSQPGGGVICMSAEQDSKTNPSLLWSYFYSALAVIMLLLLIKAEPRNVYDDDDQSQLLGNIVRQALADMKIRRYRRSMATVRNYDDSERDTCAICLEVFNFRQKIRVLPCLHEFHCKCIDPWLLQHPTCPLCKYNVVS